MLSLFGTVLCYLGDVHRIGHDLWFVQCNPCITRGIFVLNLYVKGWMAAGLLFARELPCRLFVTEQSAKLKFESLVHRLLVRNMRSNSSIHEINQNTAMSIK